jgi:DNA recombination protein RmuC
LEKRLGESFKLVSERLDAVHKGLGEMQNLATGVGDLKNVLTNVKVRGTWAEYQLEAILEQVLTPDQFDRNVATRKDSSERVEFAIRLPGRSDDPNDCVWLPIDSKFPQEDYLRLSEAANSADAEAVAQSTRELLRSITQSAKTIAEKYLNPPQTTDFAVLYLPTEGLYAEVLRQPGLVSQLQQDYRVMVSGPTTIAALLNSLRLGFRSLAIEQQASEVWQVLGAVKTEFGRFGDVLAKVKKQLATASNTIENTERRTRAMARTLREVEQLPGAKSDELLELLPEDEIEQD